MDDGAEEETGPVLPLKRNASSSSTFSSMVHLVSLSRRKLVRRWSGGLKGGGGEGLVGGVTQRMRWPRGALCDITGWMMRWSKTLCKCNF